MRFTELITESIGLANRKMADVHGTGDIFYKKDSDFELEFKNLFFLPDVGRYEDDDRNNPEILEPKTGKEKCAEAVQTFLDQNNAINIKFTNTPRPAAAIAVLTDTEEYNYFYFVRYFEKINATHPKVNWKNTQFFQDSGGFALQSKSAKSEQLLVKPTDLVPTDRLLTLEELIRTIESNANKLDEKVRNQVFQLINGVISGNNDFVEGAAQHAPAYAKYLGEILAPISLMTGNLASGSYEEAGNKILGEGSWSNLTHILFPQSKNYPSTDSMLSNKDLTQIVKISSKAGKRGGAAASLNKVAQTLSDKTIKLDPKIKDNNKELIKYIEIIVKKSIIEGPLQIGQHMGLIDENDSKVIKQFLKEPPEFQPKVSNNIKNLLTDDTSKNKSLESIGFRLMATLAKKIINHMNNLNPTPLFKEAFKHQSFVQVNAIVSKNKDALKFTNFNVTYPPNFKGTVLIVAKKYYGTAAPSEKIGFKMI